MSAPRLPDAVPRLAPEAYLARERAAMGERSELIDGVPVAMTGASLAHNQIMFNLAGLLRARMPKGCRAFVNDLRVRAGDDFFYPDLVALCDAPRLDDTARDTLLNPRLVIEVLSPSTEAFDRGVKFRSYQRVDTVAEYVLVAQDAMRVEHFRRHDLGWLLTLHDGPDAEMPLLSLGLHLPLASLYDDVELPAAAGADAFRAGTDDAATSA